LITNEGLAPALLTLSLRADPVVPAASRPALSQPSVLPEAPAAPPAAN
jgi:hypothetical protein